MRPIARPILFALATFACAAPSPESAKTTTTPAPAEWTRNAVIYEINVRQYTPEGTLAALTKHLPHLDSLGVDILWLMPVQPISVKNRKGTLGSYYAVADYTAINPEFGNAADFRSFVDEAHKLGKHVILDWVPNHTGFDHTWISAHPDWYVHKADGSISNARDNENHDTDWTDVAELNYDSKDMRSAMIGAMKWWIDSMNVDGFRCDVAGGVPDDFWSDARRELSAAKPDLFMLAEAERPGAHAAFDMTYGWELHHLMNEITKGKKPVSELDSYFKGQTSAYPAGAYRMYFTSNHDENSWNGTEFERMGANHAPAFVLSATVRNSMPLLYTGQEVSMQKRLRFFEKDTVDWNGPSLVKFYRDVFDLKHQNAALWNGAYGGAQQKLSADGASNVYAFVRTRDQNSVVVALNFGDAPAPVAYSGLTTTGEYTDWFSKSKLTLSESGTLDVPAHSYLVLVR